MIVPFLLFLDVGGGELLLILIAVFLLFGPKKIPEIARGIGKEMHEFQKMGYSRYGRLACRSGFRTGRRNMLMTKKIRPLLSARFFVKLYVFLCICLLKKTSFFTLLSMVLY